MVNRPKSIGTAAETAVARTARRYGFPNADRLTLTGALDRGDVGLCPGVIIEVKGGEAARGASDGRIESWLTETSREAYNAGAEVAFLVVQRRGVGTPNAHRWWAWWRLSWLWALTSPTPFSADGNIEHTPIRMQYGHALELLYSAGYGGTNTASAVALNQLRHRLTNPPRPGDVPGVSGAQARAGGAL